MDGVYVMMARVSIAGMWAQYLTLPGVWYITKHLLVMPVVGRRCETENP